MNDPVYRLHEAHLGDHWASMSLLRHMGKAAGRALRLSYMQDGRSFHQRLKEIDAVLDPAGRPQLVGDQPTTMFENPLAWACPVIPTIDRWTFDPRSTHVVYQFDGLSSASAKNPPAADQRRILSYLVDLGYTPIRLGGHLDLSTCVRWCAKSALFVGCCSGMSHLAHSTGIPVYLLEYGLPVITCHRQKQYVLCHGAEHFVGESASYLRLMQQLGHGT